MSGRRLRALLRKEWAEARRNRTLTWTFAFLALVLCALPLLLAFVAIGALRADLASDPGVARLLALLVAHRPQLAELSPDGRLQVLVLRQCLPLFLILPLIGAMTSATYSIVGERASRSLEPLLATPLSTGEMLLGKTIAAALPAVLGTWLAFLAFVAGTVALGGSRLAALAIDRPSWLTMVLVTPALALFGIGTGVLVSARAKDPRTAQQVGTLLVLPVMVLLVAQVAGVFLLGAAMALGGALVLFLLDAALLGWGVRLFDRDRLLAEWR